MPERGTPPPWVVNEDSWRKNHRRMVARADDLIHGRIGLVEAARELRLYKMRLHLDGDENFSIFSVIDSETDHLPFGSSRQYWDKESLEAKDQELRNIETFYRDQALDAAHKIVVEYKSIGI